MVRTIWRRRADTVRGPAAGADPVAFLIATTLIIGLLYTGRELFVPITLAILLSFALAPLVRLLRRAYLPRAVAVVAAVTGAFALLGVFAWVMAAQVTELAEDLPRYQETMREKIVSLKGAAAASDALERAADVLARLGAELTAPATDGADPASAYPPPTPEPAPLPVEIRTPPPGPIDTLQSLIGPLLHPFATTGIVIIFVIFILLQREDLRNRFIKLAGGHDLQKTTEALDDAAYRLSRLLLTQLMLNAAYGLVIALGLGAIGVPLAALWGMLAGLLRFVPYVGAVIGAALPILIAAAVEPGWTMVAQTALLFLIIEPIVGHFIEPMLFGRSTGLSPVAVVVSATFWTWLWGPIGLLLATPLTVCLVVMGRHVKGLGFIEIMLGDRPALTPPELFYQRLLAGDSDEMAAVAEEFLRERSLSEYYDQIALPGLRLAHVDLARGALDADRLFRIRETAAEVVEDLDGYPDVPSTSAASDPEAIAAVEAVRDDAEQPVLAREALAPAWRGEAAVLCLAGETPLDEAASGILAALVDKHGIPALAEGADLLSARRILELSGRGAAMVVLVFFGAPPAQIRNAVRRVRRRLPTARVLVCDFALGDGGDLPDLVARTDADAAAGTLRLALAEVVRSALRAAAAEQPEEPPAVVAEAARAGDGDGPIGGPSGGPSGGPPVPAPLGAV